MPTSKQYYFHFQQIQIMQFYTPKYYINRYLMLYNNSPYVLQRAILSPGSPFTLSPVTLYKAPFSGDDGLTPFRGSLPVVTNNSSKFGPPNVTDVTCKRIFQNILLSKGIQVHYTISFFRSILILKLSSENKLYQIYLMKDIKGLYM